MTIPPEIRDLLRNNPREALRVLNSELAERQFDHFVKLAWRTIEPKPIIWSWHLQVMCWHLQAVAEGKIRRLLINIPPRMSKSTIASVMFVPWVWLRDPSRRFLCGTAVSDVAFRDANKCHEVVDSEWYQEAFNPDWTWKASQNAKGYYGTTAGGQRISKTVGQKLIGVDGDTLISDDLLDTKAARLDRKELQEHVRWHDEDATGRMTSHDDPEVLIMQRLHEADISGHVLERKDWDYLILPAEYEGYQRSKTSLAEPPNRKLWDKVCGKENAGWPDPRTKKGELLCSRLTHDFLAERRERLGERRYAAQFQQRPAPAEGAVFHKSWFQYWTAEDLPTSFDFKVASWDTSWKEGRSNDYCVGQVWGVKGANVYLLEQDRKRMGYDEQVVHLISQHTRHPGIRITLVETGGRSTGKSVVENMKHQVPNLVGVSHQGDTKESRAESVAPRWAAKQVYLPHPHEFPWVEGLRKELLAFPVGRHDDQVDAMTQALIWINENPSTMPTMFVL